MKNCLTSSTESESTTIKHGSLLFGNDCTIGRNIYIDVDEEVVLGDRCVVPDNARFEGRRIEIGDDFYGYSWEWRRLDVGRGRRGCPRAVLKVGKRCTFHDNRIDLAREVTIGDDVGLSPEVAIYTHSYWQSPLAGFPTTYKPVEIGDNTLIGFRSVLVPGAKVWHDTVIGAQSVVTGELMGCGVYAGSPAKAIKRIDEPTFKEKRELVRSLVTEYGDPFGEVIGKPDTLHIIAYGCAFDLQNLTVTGEENERTDDFRDFLFKHGIRIYTKRPFRRPRRG